MGKGVIYARVSTEKQREKHTIASQLSILPELMKQKGYIQVQEPYIDDGISGETINDEEEAIRLLDSFWEDNSANSLYDTFLNQWLVSV
jgi:DNA invertase Pin-like site-specific DNA recombinase